MKLALAVYGDDPKQRSVELDGPGPFLVGRSPEADCRLHDKRVAEAHLRIEIEGSTVRARDLSGPYGTEVDGVRLSGKPNEPSAPAPLRNGSEIELARGAISIVVNFGSVAQLRSSETVVSAPPAPAAPPHAAAPEGDPRLHLAAAAESLAAYLKVRPRDADVAELAIRLARAIDRTEIEPPPAAPPPRAAASRPAPPADDRPIAHPVAPAAASPRAEFARAAVASGRVAGLDGFRILATLGETGTMIVFKAEHVETGRVVALKLFDPVKMSETAEARFRTEAEILMRLRDPGVARLLQTGIARAPQGDRPFQALEYVEGTPLLDHVAARASTVRERVEILAALCDTLHAVHERGVLHRDLKPSGVLVDATGRPRILDFGKARLVDSAQQLTRAGQIVGNLGSLAPEQMSGRSEDLDRRVDVYALGVLGYTLLAGKPPLDLAGKGLADALRMVRDAEPESLGAIARIGAPLADAIHKALAKDRDRRFATAGEMADALRAAAGIPPSAPAPATVPAPAPEPARPAPAAVPAPAPQPVRPAASDESRITLAGPAPVPPPAPASDSTDAAAAAESTEDLAAAIESGGLDRVGPYAIVSRIATGRTATVFEAVYPGLPGRFAIKILKPSRMDPKAVERFMKEGAALYRLEHAGIAKIFQTGALKTRRGECPYHVLELIEGKPLLVFADRERLDLDARIEIVVRLCDAMDYAHRRGVIHRDLKPSNVLVRPDLQPKILDFGIARLAQGGQPLTAPGQIMGNLTYMSPEQLAGDREKIGERADVYALGGIAYTLFTGGTPPLDFQGMNVGQVMRAIVNDPPASLRSRNIHCPAAIEKAVHKALAKDPADRQPSADALAADLRRARAGGSFR